MDEWNGRWRRRKSNRWIVETNEGVAVATINKRPGGSKDFGDDNGDLIAHSPELHDACSRALGFLQAIPLDGTLKIQAAHICEYLEYAIDCPPPCPGDFKFYTGK